MRPVTRLVSLPVVAAFALVVGLAAPAEADLTAFIGFSPTPSNHMARGFAVGVGLVIVGFEFEYANAGEDEDDLAPSLTTVSGNVLVQTPDLTGWQLYGTLGAGGYRERLIERQETHVSTNLGGGLKIKLAGPLRVRVDYRLFSLQGSPLHDKVHRFYVGANLNF
jgi:hypothetical protein